MFSRSQLNPTLLTEICMKFAYLDVADSPQRPSATYNPGSTNSFYCSLRFLVQATILPEFLKIMFMVNALTRKGTY